MIPAFLYFIPALEQKYEEFTPKAGLKYGNLDPGQGRNMKFYTWALGMTDVLKFAPRAVYTSHESTQNGLYPPTKNRGPPPLQIFLIPSLTIICWQLTQCETLVRNILNFDDLASQSGWWGCENLFFQTLTLTIIYFSYIWVGGFGLT